MTTAHRIVDPAKEEINVDDENKDTQDPAKVEIPDKFQNKSLEDVIHSYTELEKAYGRQSADLGELRKVTDSILLKQLEESNQEQDEQLQHEAVEFEDFVQDPEGSVDKLVSRKLKKVEDRLSDIDKVTRFSVFEKKHSDWQEHVGSENFQEWVKASPYRTNLFQRADQYDTEAADELFTTWKERQEFVAAQNEKEERLKQEQINSDLRKASSESGSTGQSPGKTFRRADLIRMRAYEPEKYASMQAEIREAYMKGNVK
jgi:hypothetical protein